MFKRRWIFLSPTRDLGLTPIGAAIALLFAFGLLELAIALWPTASPAPAARPVSCEPGTMAAPGRTTGAHADTPRAPGVRGTWM